MQNTMNDVQRVKYRNTILQLRACPLCNYPGGVITVDLPAYGRTGARIRCIHCGYSTDYHRTNKSLIEAPEQFATPTTAQTVTKGIFDAVAEWNSTTPTQAAGQIDFLNFNNRFLTMGENFKRAATADEKGQIYKIAKNVYKRIRADF